jgi:hypothetical protein
MPADAEEVSVAAATPIPIYKILPWAFLLGLLAVIAYYFVGVEGGAFNHLGGMTVHEWVHDARHLLGFPCH